MPIIGPKESLLRYETWRMGDQKKPKNCRTFQSCIAIKMCSPLDYDIYLKRTHANEEFSYELPPDFHDKLTEYYKNTLVAVSSNSSSVVVLHNISSSHFPLLCVGILAAFLL